MLFCNNQYLTPVNIYAFCFFIVIFVTSKPALAEPYLSIHTALPCQSCHVNPTGGGMRNDYGRRYGNIDLVTEKGNNMFPDIGKLTEFLSIGGNYRTAFQQFETPDITTKTSGFEIQSGQLYLHAKTGLHDLSLYIDQKVAPDRSITREFFLLKYFQNGHYLKAGKMIPFLGFKLEDDTAYVRQISGFNFNTHDSGIEYGIVTDSAIYRMALNTGNSDSSNQDGKYRKILGAEYYLDNWRLGATYSVNPGIESDTDTLALFAGYRWNDWSFLTELTYISDDSNTTNVFNRKQLATIFEVNWKFQPGHNLKFTGEIYDPDRSISGDHQVRHSLVYELTPISHIQYRMGMRLKETPPEFVAQELKQYFAQLHFYF